MPGVRSIYFNAKAEKIVEEFAKKTKHKFSPAVCILIENNVDLQTEIEKISQAVSTLQKAYNAQREANANLGEQIRDLRLKKIDPTFKETEQIQ